MQKKEPYILWLPSWYPNPDDPFDGDFIQRHARAAALDVNVHVLFVKPIRQEAAKEEVVHQNGRLTEQSIYIRKEHGGLKKLMRQARWFRTYVAAIRTLIRKNGAPQLVHLHVPWRAGIIALWVKQTFKVPYLVTEHWDIYNDVVDDRFSRQSWWLQLLIKRVYRQAAGVAPVSRFIGDAISCYVVPKPYTVISNVVDTMLFSYNPAESAPFTFLHVSNMVPKKNVSGLLEAFAKFQQSGVDARLVLIGNRDDTYVKLAKALQLKNVTFKGEIAYAEVARHMQAAQCLIVNSLMENAPCVIGEALCCGLPVIATAVGGIPELVDVSNGILIPPANTEALAKAMSAVYGGLKKFDRKQIAATAAARFGAPTIANQFLTLYLAAGAALP